MRKRVAQALGKFQDTRVSELLRTLLTDESTWVRDEAVKALTGLHPENWEQSGE